MSVIVEGRIGPEGGSLYIILPKSQIAILDATAMGNHLYLNRVNVPAPHQGIGLGSRLVATLIEQAKLAGHERIIVEPGGYDPSRHDDQIRFYERHGFTKQPEGHYALELAH
jgi:predicted N-acetyltransferase YhbS